MTAGNAPSGSRRARQESRARSADTGGPRGKRGVGASAVSARWPSEWAVCLGLFLLAALVRALFLRGTIDKELPFSIFYYGDSRLYREFALALMRGESFDQGIPYHPPLFAYVLSLVIGVVGENPGAMRAVLAVGGATAAPLTYLLGRVLWGRVVGLTGALLATFSFGLSVAAVSPNTETIYIPLLVAQGLATVGLCDAFARSEGRRVLMLSIANGALVGLGSLTRAEHLAFLVIVPLALLLSISPRDAGVGPASILKKLAAACAGFLLSAAIIIAPWTIHNYLALSRFNAENPQLAERLPVFVAVSNYGALNFALANGPGADGAFKPDLIVRDTGTDRLDLKDPRQLSIYLHGYGMGLAYLTGNPGEGARLILEKLEIGLDALALGFGASDWPGGLTGTRRAVDIFSPDKGWFIAISALLVLAGAIVSRALWRRGSVIWLIVLHKVLICAAFFGYVRLFVQILPFLYLLQAAAIVVLVSAIGSTRARRAVAAGGLILAGALFIELAVRSANPRNFSASGSSDPANGKLIQDAPLRLAPL